MIKKLSKYYLSSMVALSLFVGNAFAAKGDDPAAAGSPLCKLLNEFGGVINTLRILAFVGAAFVMMDWAWGYIQKGEVGKDDLKNKGVGLLVGFALLFGTGLLLGLLSSTSTKASLGCIETIFTATK